MTKKNKVGRLMAISKEKRYVGVSERTGIRWSVPKKLVDMFFTPSPKAKTGFGVAIPDGEGNFNIIKINDK